jgi:hypothetical protein
MAQAKAKIEVETQPEPNKGILGKQIKFAEAIKLDDEQSPVTSARAPYIVKLLPNGWAAIQKTPTSIATLVPANNILYFIPTK